MTVEKGKNIEFASMTWEKYMPSPQPSSACIYANGRWALVVTEKFLRFSSPLPMQTVISISVLTLRGPGGHPGTNHPGKASCTAVGHVTGLA